MDFIAGLIMLVVFLGLGGYALSQNDFEYGTRFILQMIISGGGAAYILFKNLNIEWLKSLFNKGEKVDIDIEITEKDLVDYKVLVYLRGRAKEMGSKEMMDAVVLLNNMLFTDVEVKK